jgi:hypothetical protein
MSADLKPWALAQGVVHLALAAFVFILILDGNRWDWEKGHLCTTGNKHVHTISRKQTGGEE